MGEDCTRNSLVFLAIGAGQRLHRGTPLEDEMPDEFLTEQELAARWKMSAKTLTRWRTIRRGPPFLKLGQTVRYAMSDVLEFERQGLRKPVPRNLPTLDERAPDQPARLLTIKDVVAGLRLGMQ